MNKKIYYSEPVKCGLTDEIINTKTDPYTIIAEYNGDEEVSVAFYKTKPLNDLIKNNQKELVKNTMEKTKEEIRKLTGGMFGSSL